MNPPKVVRVSGARASGSEGGREPVAQRDARQKDNGDGAGEAGPVQPDALLERHVDANAVAHEPAHQQLARVPVGQWWPQLAGLSYGDLGLTGRVLEGAREAAPTGGVR